MNPPKHIQALMSNMETSNDTSPTNSHNGDEPYVLPRHSSFEDEEAPSSLGDDSESDTSDVESSRRINNLENKKDTELVNCSKMFVVMVVSLLAAVMGVSVYVYVARDEQSTFDTSYNNVVHEITTNCQQRTQSILESLEAVSLSLTNQANLVGMEWPFVTFPDFQVQGMVSNTVTGAYTLALHPFVNPDDRSAWEQYSVDHQNWIERAHFYDTRVSPRLYQPRNYSGPQNNEPQNTQRLPWNESGVTPFIWQYSEEELERVEQEFRQVYYPLWQKAPAEDFYPTTNRDFGLDYESVIDSLIRTKRPRLTPTLRTDENQLTRYYDGRFDVKALEAPKSFLLNPVYDTLLDNSQMVAFLSAYISWDQFFVGALPDSQQVGVVVVMHGTCQDQPMTFLVNGQGAQFLADADLHDPRFDELKRDFDFSDYLRPAGPTNADSEKLNCAYSASIYPTMDFVDEYFTDFPIIYAVMVITCFVIATICFAIYDILVQKRQRKLLETANKTNAIVSSLFPSNVRDRLLEELDNNDSHHHPKPTEKTIKAKDSRNGSLTERGSVHGSSSFAGLGMDESQNGSFGWGVATSETIFGSKPIADLFPSTTIMFADMVGFTAWSSTREPTAVFTLLETVYHSFDAIAKKRRVFKVETIGDCYVAVCGLPIANKNHAVNMCRFASDCLCRMNELTAQLEKTLGPDTADLCLRIGLHSGPVTAGVLRGEKGRFQLFGDTMNTASRLETTGAPNRVQISSETAAQLVACGKSGWMIQREDKVHAKGKGDLTTYWLRISVDRHGAYKSTFDESDHNLGQDNHSEGGSLRSFGSNKNLLSPYGDTDRTQRLIDYNVDILSNLLHKIVVRRASHPPKMTTRSQRKQLKAKDGPVLDEVRDILELPQFDASVFKKTIDPDSIALSPRVLQQLSMYVSRIADLYRDNPFHNFEHASHVTMSVTKLLSRIVNPNQVHNRQDKKQEKVAQQFHDHTFGITSDPLTHFGCVLSALIHDADHPGVSNAVLVTEKTELAERYHNKSVAEQNSVDRAWQTLMQDEFEDLRACIYCNEEEFNRFRSIVVNIVMATDIMDKELGSLRKARWEKAFSLDCHKLTSEEDDPTTMVNRRATIVLEHLIQASDVAHTMQHWHVYRKWNERLFHEMYKAFLEGRIDTDPSKGWYKGEIGFFDYYIIPLAKKLETCGVFGVSSDEYLQYALANRAEWESKGEGIVQEYLNVYRDS